MSSDVDGEVRAYQLQDTPEGVRGVMTRVPIEFLGEGDLLIRVTHSSVNYKDGLAATGAAKIARRLPLIGGIDAAGIVVACENDRFTPGDRVVVTGFDMSEKHDGGYADYLRVPTDWAVKVPAGMTLWESMVLGTAGVTAALGIHQLELNGLRPGQGPVAVTGASGGVGSLAVAMLAALGYDVVAFTGKAQAHEELRRLGAADIEARPDTSEIRPLGSQTWAASMDSVGGQTLAWLASSTKRGGSIASYGNAGGAAVSTTVLPFILRGVNLLGINSGWFPDDVRARLWERMASDLKVDLAAIGTTRPFEDLPDVCREIVGASVMGRTVIEVSGEQGPR
ncbi:MAG: acryloyl-CoA reductase [Nostocoides sp.]